MNNSKVKSKSFGVRFYKKGAPNISSVKMAVANQSKKVSIAPEPHVQPEDQAIAETTIAKEQALWHATRIGDLAMIRLLVVNGVDLKARDPMGRTAINIATQYRQMESLKTLLAAKQMRRMAALGELPDTNFYRRFKARKTV